MARRADKTRVLKAQLAGTRQRLHDLDGAIAAGRALPDQRGPVLERIAHLEKAIVERPDASPD